MFSAHKHKKKNLHSEKLCICRFVQICDFCIWKNICAADLRILCTTHFCTFADLHICHLHICRNLRRQKNVLRTCASLWKRFAKVCAHVKFCFLHFWQFFANLLKISKKSKIPKMSENVKFGSVGFWRVPENVRKKLTCSWVVHEWFLGQRVWQHRVAKVARICIN